MKTKSKSNKKFAPRFMKVSHAIGGAATTILAILFGEVVWKLALSVWDTVCEVAAQHFLEVFTPVHVMTVFTLVLMLTAFVVVFNRLWIKWAQTQSIDSNEVSETDESYAVLPAGRANKRGGAFLDRNAG